MAYQRTTKFFQIPYMGVGDYLNEEDEGARAQIIDNLLYVATYGSTNCILVDGEYQVDPTTPSTLRITSNNSQTIDNSPVVFSAIVSGYLAYSISEVVLTDLSQGSVWNVYVQFSDEIKTQPEMAAVMASTDSPPEGSLLLATFDYTGTSPVLNSNPTGKTLYANLATHSLNSSNPHGSELTQAKLKVSESLEVSGFPIFPYTIIEVELNGLTPVTITPISTNIDPVFAQILPIGNIQGTSIYLNGTDVVVSSTSAGRVKVKIEGNKSL